MDTTTLLIAVGTAAVAGTLAFVFLWPAKPAISSDGRTAKERADIDAFNKGVCPDCGEPTLLAGPSGGMSQNVLCNSCLMEFNVFMSFGQGPLGMDRTGKADQGRAGVFGVSPEEYRSIVS